MAGEAEKKPGWADSPLYAEGVAHFEAEEWESALAVFSQLEAEFPGDRELRQILADLRLRASLHQMEVGRDPMRTRRVGRVVLLVMGVAALIVVLAAVSYAVSTNWLLPARTASEEASHLRELHELARGYMAAGDYATASDLYSQILSEVPHDATAAAGLERVEELQKLATAYDSAMQLSQEERWDEALEAWQAILAVDPNFRDVKYWIDFVESQDSFSALLSEAEQHYESENWSAAIEALEELRAQSPSYRRDQVEALLVTSLVSQARQILREAPDPAEVDNEIMDLFAKAIQISPQDESVLAERAAAEAYFRGYALFEGEDWEGATEELLSVYEFEAGYAAGQAAELLYRAYVRCGDQRTQGADLQGALACYDSATELQVEDTSEANTKRAALIPVLTATPTLIPATRSPVPMEPPSPPTPTATLSPYRFYYVQGSAQTRDRTSCFEGASVKGWVLDAGGNGIFGVWVRLQWWGNEHASMTGPAGDFGFAPLAPEHYDKPVPFRLTVVRSQGNASPLSETVRLDSEGCGTHSGFINVTFRAFY